MGTSTKMACAHSPVRGVHYINSSDTAINAQDNGWNEKNRVQEWSDSGDLFSDFSNIDETYVPNDGT